MARWYPVDTRATQITALRQSCEALIVVAAVDLWAADNVFPAHSTACVLFFQICNHSSFVVRLPLMLRFIQLSWLMFESHTSNTRAASNLSKTCGKWVQSDVFKWLILLQLSVQNSNINIISSFIFYKWERKADSPYTEGAGTKQCLLKKIKEMTGAITLLPELCL